MTFGEQNTFSESFGLLDQAFQAGINFFDSAEMYPVVQRAQTQGRSEEYLGRWIRERSVPRNSVVLATKVTGPSGQMTWIRDGPKCLNAKNITEAIDGSLRRLQTDYIDLYQIHWPDRYVPMFGEIEYDPTRQFCSIPIDEQLDALGRAVDSGKIRYVGLSNETPYGMMKFVQVAERGTRHPKIVSVQNSYSLLCRTFDSGLAECCHHERISLLAYSPLAMGILSGKYFLPDGGPADARLNLFRGKYSEGESRYNLSDHIIRAAAMEARCMTKARRLGVYTPVLYSVDIVLHTLTFEYVEGPSVKDIFLEFGLRNGAVVEERMDDIAMQIGHAIGKLHDGGLIHGDLTTSNMLIRAATNQLVVIDFGLSFTSTLPEDKAVDLYVLERALLSMHSSCGNVMDRILAAYRKSSKQWSSTLNKLAQVRQRGRKRTMVG